MNADSNQPKASGKMRIAICWQDGGTRTRVRIQPGDATPQAGSPIRRVRCAPVSRLMLPLRSIHTTFSNYSSL
jgi:hypothetical protein